LGRPKAIFKENKESMFVKSYNNTYTLKKSLNENIEEKWNESVEETLEEALNAAQQKAYDEFLIDLGKMFNKSKDEVIPFMQSQGTRFKNVLDYLNQNVTPTQAPTAPAPEQQPVQQPNQVKPSLAKHINGIKGSALFTGDLAARIQKTIDFPVDKDATKNVRSMIELRTFLKSLNGILNTNSANYRKQIGDPSVLLQQVNEDIKEYSSLAKQISDVMPSLVGATFELRQMYGKRQSSAPGGKAPAGAVPPVIKEEDIKLGGSLGQAKSNLSVEELSRAKFFLSKLVDIGLLVKSINVAQADQVQMKNLYKNLLELANLVVNKNVKGIKLNKKIDSAFQGKDILGPNAVDKKQSPVKQGPGDIFKEGKKNNFKLR
jgi:superfamily I DNA and/or RNA helicase